MQQLDYHEVLNLSTSSTWGHFDLTCLHLDFLYTPSLFLIIVYIAKSNNIDKEMYEINQRDFNERIFTDIRITLKDGFKKKDRLRVNFNTRAVTLAAASYLETLGYNTMTNSEGYVTIFCKLTKMPETPKN